jgi:hypothetical protein
MAIGRECHNRVPGLMLSLLMTIKVVYGAGERNRCQSRRMHPCGLHEDRQTGVFPLAQEECG